MTPTNPQDQHREAAKARYIEMLKDHDWDFAYSDDARVWRHGRLAQECLDYLHRELDPDSAIWNEHCPEAYRLKPLNTDPRNPTPTNT